MFQRERMAPTKKYHRKVRFHSRDWATPVNNILLAYIDACNDPILGCSRFSEDFRPKTNSFRLAEYRIDCERGFRAALKDRPHLITALENLLTEMTGQALEAVSLADRTEVIQRLGPALVATWRLSPGNYFSQGRTRRKRSMEFQRKGE